jgi:hypothetical protein
MILNKNIKDEKELRLSLSTNKNRKEMKKMQWLREFNEKSYLAFFLT